MDKAVLNFKVQILHALNNKVRIGGISCDLAKVSDCVNEDILLS
jgi:hypothetical protein